MTMDIPPPNDETSVRVKLFPHDPSTIIPLLELHTPKSLPVLSTILENLSRPKSSKGEGEYDVVWTTFPPAELEGIMEERSEMKGQGVIWAAVVRMQEEDSIHLRFYCSAESVDQADAQINHGSEGRGGQQHGENEEQIQSFIKGITECIILIWGKKVTLGAICSRWNSTMRQEVDARELVECSVFLAPDLMGDQGDVEREMDEDEKRLEAMGLGFDIAREGDVKMIKSTCDVPRPHKYYASRCSQSTVIRLLDPPHTAICWIILHSDGAIGALYTLPNWRRKGLAEMAVKHHIILSKKENTNFCYVFKGNLASEGLWRKMGWKEGWGVRWIVNREIEEVRGKVARFSHKDEQV